MGLERGEKLVTWSSFVPYVAYQLVVLSGCFLSLFDAALTSPGKSFCHVKHAFIAVCHILGIHFIDSS